MAMKLSLVVLLAAFFAVSFALGGLVLNGPPRLIVDHAAQQPAQPVVSRPVFATPDVRTATALLPAVNSDGSGVLTKAEIKAGPGSGGVFTNVETISTATETQASFRAARDAAAAWAGVDPKEIDVTITIVAEEGTEYVEGPSAGASVAAAIGAAIKGLKLRQDAAMTGTIGPDGRIGPVGGIRQKIEAASKVGITAFLVPPGQGAFETVTRKQTCTVIGRVTYCKTVYAPSASADRQEAAGITVKQVSTLSQAMDFLLVQPAGNGA